MVREHTALYQTELPRHINCIHDNPVSYGSASLLVNRGIRFPACPFAEVFTGPAGMVRSIKQLKAPANEGDECGLATLILDLHYFARAIMGLSPVSTRCSAFGRMADPFQPEAHLRPQRVPLRLSSVNCQL